MKNRHRDLAKNSREMFETKWEIIFGIRTCKFNLRELKEIIKETRQRAPGLMIIMPKPVIPPDQEVNFTPISLLD